MKESNNTHTDKILTGAPNLEQKANQKSKQRINYLFEEELPSRIDLSEPEMYISVNYIPDYKINY